MAIINAPGSSGSLVTGKLVYRGFSLRETSGSASALVRLFDNASAASGTILDEISLTANQSARENYDSDDYQIVATSGIYYQLVSGAVTGSIRYELG